MRVNWFSPLSPTQTESAVYTEQILPIISQKLEVTPRSHLDDISLQEINQARLNIYLLGEDKEIHQDIYKLSNQIPGIIIILGGEWYIKTAIGILTHSEIEYQKLLEKNSNLLLAYTAYPQEEQLPSYSQDIVNFTEKVVKLRASITASNLLLQRITQSMSIWNNPIVFDEEMEHIAQAVHFFCD